MTTVDIRATDLVITVNGLDRLWTFKSQITIPLAHVRGATADPGIVRESKGRRAPGLHIPGVIVAGTFRQDGERTFWDVHDLTKAIVIELHDDTYRRLVIEVDDPRATVEVVEQALAHHDD
jgi:hypothetical protein